VELYLHSPVRLHGVHRTLTRRNKNSGQCHGLDTEHLSLHATESVGIDKNFTTVYCRQEVADKPLPRPSEARSIHFLSYGRLHDSSLASSEETVLGGRNHIQQATQQN
jgi:hypothetical protein